MAKYSLRITKGLIFKSIILKSSFLTVLIFLQALVIVQAGQNPTLLNIENDTWVNLNAPLDSSFPDKPPSETLAYSGMAYDSFNHKILLFGGGHNNGYDDRVWAFDFDTLKWTPEYAATGDPKNLPANYFDEQNYPGAIFNPPGESIADAHPISLHTYDNLTFITNSPNGTPVNEMFMAGAASYSGSPEVRPYWPNDPDFTWTYNHQTKKWTWRDVGGGRINSEEPSGKGTASEYDPSTGLVFLFEGNSNPGEVWSYNIDQDKWSKYATIDHIGIEIAAAYVDRAGESPAIYVFGTEFGPEGSADTLYKFDIASKNWSEIPTGSIKPPAGGGYGLAYDSRNDVLLAYKQNGRIYAYRFDLKAWEQKAQGPVDPFQPGRIERVHGNFQFDPINNVVIFTHISNFRVETWAYRYKQQQNDSTASSIPNGLNISQVTETSALLSWSAASDPESGVSAYRIYRGGQLIDTISGLSYDDTGLTESSSYVYQVSAVNGAGIESGLSTTSTITTIADTSPPTIVSTFVNGNNPTIVSLNFSETVETNSAQNIGNYQVSNSGVVSASALADNNSTVNLTMQNLTAGNLYEVSVNNVLDRSIVGNPILPDTKISFFLDDDGSQQNPPNNEEPNNDVPSVVISTGNNSAATVPVTFGQVFKPGYVPQGSTLEIGTPTQVDSKTFYPDGSLKHAILTTEVPSGSDTVLVLETEASSPLTPSLDLNSLIASGYNLTASLNVVGTNYSASAIDFLQNAQVTTWLSGPLVSEWIVGGSPSSGSVPHPYLTVYFHVRYYRDGRVRTDVKVENTKTFLNKQTISYDVVISQNGQTIYSKSNLDHYMHGYWRKRFWWKDSGDADPQTYVKHDMQYLRATKAVPNYDTGVSISSQYLQSMTQSIEPMQVADLRREWNTAGSHDQKAPLPRWTAAYLLTGDQHAFNSVVANSDSLGSFSLNYRDENTGLPTRIDGYNPVVSITVESGGIPDDGITSVYQSSNYRAHQPSLGYVAYLVTGDYCHLETTWFLGNYNLLFAAPNKKNGQAGEFLRDEDYELRGWGWGLRNLAHAAYVTPDDHPLKSYFVDRVNNNLNYLSVNFASNTSFTGYNIGAVEQLIPFATELGGPRHWMYWFFHWSLGHLSELGFAADPVRNWSAKLAAGMMGTDGGYCYQFASRNKSEFGPGPDRGVAFQSFAELYNNYSNAQTSLPCGSQAMANWMSQNIGEEEGVSFTAGQMLGNVDIADGWYANMQPALAIAVDAGVAGQAEWDRFTGKNSSWASKITDYEDAPQFAIVPRSIGTSPPPTNSLPIVSISANPSSITAGEATELSWSSVNATSCQAVNSWTTSTATNGKQNVNPQQSTTYLISCTGNGGTQAASVNVTVVGAPNPNPAPTVSINAAPRTISLGESSTISWQSENAMSCQATNGWTTSTATQGSQSVTPQARRTYTINCMGAGGTASANVIVSVTDPDSPSSEDSGSTGGNTAATSEEGGGGAVHPLFIIFLLLYLHLCKSARFSRI